MELKTKAIKSTAWYTGNRLWTQSLSWGVTLILARLLSPAEYGLFGMAMAVIATMELFQQFGLGAAIVQKQNLSKQQVNAMFWIAVVPGFILFLLTFIIGDLIASFYNEPKLLWLVRALGLMFFLNALGVVPNSLLSKAIDFRRRSIAESLAVTISVLVSVSLAYWNFGVWALVGGHLVRFIIRNVGLCVLCRWRPTFDVSFHGVKDILNFGLRVSGANAVKVFSGFINAMIIGKVLGSSALGLYSMANAVGTNPLHKVFTNVLSQVSFPIFSKLQNDEGELRKYFLKITKYLAMVALPSQIGLALVGHDLIYVMLSEKWLPILEVFQVFCINGIFYIVYLPMTPILTARGKSSIVLRFQIFSAVVIGITFFIGAQSGLRGIAFGMLIAFPILRTMLLMLSLKEIKLKVWNYVANLAVPIISTVVMGVGLVAGQYFLLSEMGVILRLVLSIGAGAMMYCLMMFVLDRRLGTELKSIVEEIFKKSGKQELAT